MYLRRLELTGFKSFADRTELEFVPGITAVVGPNGSGKSNISDAIRWVLGEQSAKSLRGAKMEDIIFSGSDSRKPVNYSEVSLTLDNVDRSLDIEYSEVTVTRRVYRSGESEYFINKQGCRMKDIIELFMDTGVGKEAYSIIGQGRIEEILSTKSEDRRIIFEEASGIVKYKSRKKEAEKKLDETGQNLVRINDIIGEISEQIGPLEEQAKRAEAYRQLKAELESNEISLYVHQIEELHGKWNAGKELLGKLQEQQTVISVEVGKRDAQVEEIRWKMNELDQLLEESQQQLLKASEELEKTEGQREVLRERKRNFSRNQSDLTLALDNLAAKKEDLYSQQKREQMQLEETTELLQQSEERLKNEEEQLAGATIDPRHDPERLKDEHVQLLNLIVSFRNDLQHLELAVSAGEEKRTRLVRENERYLGEREEVEQRREHLLKLLDEVSGQLKEGIESFKRTDATLRELAGKRESQRRELRQWEQRVDALISRREVLKEMQADFSGFVEGVKEVLRARNQHLQGIHGAVAELIKVPAAYEIAVEIALGGALQHIVTNDEQVGRKAIQFLKERKLGRATFLPLDVIRSRRLSKQDEALVRNEQGVIGIASELVEYDATYQGIVENLLGNVVVAERLEDANRVARLLGYRCRIVTLEGDVVNPGGSMTGGVIKHKNSNLIGRQRQIEQLEEEIRSANEQKTAVSNTLQDVEREIITLEKEQEQRRSRGEQLRIREQELKGQVSQVEVEKKNLDQRLSEYDREKAAYDDEILRASKKIEQIKHELVVAQEQEEQKRAEIKQADDYRKEKEESRQEAHFRITEAKVQVAEMRQKYEACLANYNRISSEVHLAETEHERIKQQLQSLQQEMLTSDGDESAAEQQIAGFRVEKERLAEWIVEQRNKRHEMQRDLEHQEIENKEFRRQLRQVEDELHKEEVQVNRCDVELDNLLSKLREDYEISYEGARERYPKTDNMEEVKRTVVDLKRQITALGTVNLGAIEEFSRLSERLQFLTEQKEDMTGAMDTLYRVISEMNEEMSRRFATTFEEIREYFQDVFSRLFGGGRADLRLSEPDDLLNTGIEIVAQPPGKKLQHLALLSGGEKALTAIALLFAILHVKPVPFCVLDEVEAALDEANVNRFAQYLREFSNQTQFIVVTHRKGTMEEADVLYGITMQESGVSKLVSVRLEDRSKMITESA